MQSGGGGGGGVIGRIGFENNDLLTLFNEMGADSQAVFFLFKCRYSFIYIYIYIYIYILVD